LKRVVSGALIRLPERVSDRAAAGHAYHASRAQAARVSRTEMSPHEPHSDPADSSALKGKRGLRRVLNAARYSLDGLAAAWRNEDAFRQEAVLAAILIPVALLLPVGLVEKVLLVGVVLLVLIVELLNSGIEAAIDRDSLNIDDLGKRAKDLGSAAVMLSLLLAAGTWVAIISTRFLA
jgi:diacylglycerol kinase (ATP)